MDMVNAGRRTDLTNEPVTLIIGTKRLTNVTDTAKVDLVEAQSVLSAGSVADNFALEKE
ncbi:MAG: hypothetical protein LIO68_04325 [Rikenellaceae bacterium]|nr:hypothetical protein [Rikenellaceae bacterium]